MNQLDAVLAALTHAEGRALRTASMRHRRLLDSPMTLSVWQLGSEPFSAAAIGYGTASGSYQIIVAGDPRSRDLSFAALLTFANWFLPRFEAPNASRETLVTGTWARELSSTLPQILVPNRGTIELIGRLGRRLAYLRTDGDRPAPLELVRLGQHFQFIARHADVPGQQLIVPLAEVLAAHWATPQTDFERASLGALDAFVEPPAGQSGFDAAAAAELVAVGPTPSGDDDERLQPLVADFNAARARRTERSIVEPLLGAITRHYRSLIDPAWALMWRAMRREQAYPEAPSVARRWDEDRAAYVRHMDWIAISGRVRTRQSARQAIDTMRRMEDAKARLIAEEALDDPLRMIPSLLDGKAIEGQVVGVDLNHAEVPQKRLVRRPLLTIRSESDRGVPAGKELWWTSAPGARPWIVHAVAPAPGGGTLVTMKLQTSRNVALPAVGSTMTFSIHNTAFRPLAPLPTNPPWPLRPVAVEAPAPIEANGADAA
jgi:hypothetical protein